MLGGSRGNAPSRGLMFSKPRPKRLEKLDAQRARTQAWRAVRLKVFARDGFTCRVCKDGRKSVYDAHHLLARSLGGRDVIGNLLTVCRDCHADIHGHVVVLRWRDDTNRAGSLRIERVR